MNRDIKQLCELTRTKLKQSIALMEHFLNNQSLVSLAGAEPDPQVEEFYVGFLSDLRHLLVFSEVYDEKLGICLRRPSFNEESAERILYDIYHRCVNSFFYPKNESYSEDGRYAYKGEDLIRFRKKPVKEARNIILSLWKIFEDIREDLAYYENDYVNEKRLRGERV